MNFDAAPQPKKPSTLESLPAELHIGTAGGVLVGIREKIDALGVSSGPLEKYKLLLIERLLQNNVVDTTILVEELKKDFSFNPTMFKKACSDLEVTLRLYP